MTRITGHFDGKVVIPDDPARLKPDQKVSIEGEAAEADFGTLAYIWRHMSDPLPTADAQEMLRAIKDAFDQIDPEPDVQF